MFDLRRNLLDSAVACLLLESWVLPAGQGHIVFNRPSPEIWYNAVSLACLVWANDWQSIPQNDKKDAYLSDAWEYSGRTLQTRSSGTAMSAVALYRVFEGIFLQAWYCGGKQSMKTDHFCVDNHSSRQSSIWSSCCGKLNPDYPQLSLCNANLVLAFSKIRGLASILIQKLICCTVVEHSLLITNPLDP